VRPFNIPTILWEEVVHSGGTPRDVKVADRRLPFFSLEEAKDA